MTADRPAGVPPRPPFVPHPAAVVSGYAAHALGQLLNRAEVRDELVAQLAQGRASAAARAQVVAAVQAIRLAGAAWADALAASPGRSQVAQQREAAAPSSRDDEIGTQEAAAMLEVTPRRVQQLAEPLGGRHVGGRLRFSPAAVVAYRDARTGRAA